MEKIFSVSESSGGGKTEDIQAILADRAKEERKKSWDSSILDGAYYKGERIGNNANAKALYGLSELSEHVAESLWAHGVGSHVPNGLTLEQSENFPIHVLYKILTTGELKGDVGRPDGSQLYADAPFILISNKDEDLAEDDSSGKYMLKNLRAVLVNGQYEGLIPDLKKLFPGISFVSSEEINDSFFDTKAPIFKPVVM